MIRRVTLENYMSHVHTVIEPAAGLTVLVGPNNCGKSAVVSALETLCNNASGGYMVRHEEKEARGTVETDDGHTLVRRRQGNKVTYSIDGREIDRLKRSVPEELHKLLRLPKVEGGESDDPFDIHFGTQKSPIFLLNESPNRAAHFFASSSDAAILLEMQKRHRHKVKERKSEEKRLKGEIKNLDGELAALEPLDALAASVGQADDRYQELREFAARIQALGKEIEALRVQSVKHDRLAEEYQCLSSLMLPPDLADTSALESLIAHLVDAEYQVQRERARYRALKSLSPPPSLDDVRGLESLCRNLSREVRNHRGWNAKADSLVKLRSPPILDDPASLEKLVADLASARLGNGTHSRRHGALESLTSPPDLADPKSLAELIGRLEDALRDVAGHKDLMRRTAAGMGQPAGRRARRSMLIVASGLIGMAATIVFFIFGPAWLNRPHTGETEGTHNVIDPIHKAVAKAEIKAVKENATGSSHGEDKPVGPTSKEVAKTDVKTKTGSDIGSPAETQKVIAPTPKEAPKTEDGERTRNQPPARQAAEETRRQRLQEVRQLLKDAEIARERGKYLDAVLGFGQAAVLYPQELAEVENPEKVRLQFLDALKRYQAEVERALQKAAEQKAGGRQAGPKISDSKSR